MDCEDCMNHAQELYLRGEIELSEVARIATDRHELKGCDKKDLNTQDLKTVDLNNLTMLECNYSG